jgi:hypothetical protein
MLLNLAKDRNVCDNMDGTREHSQAQKDKCHLFSFNLDLKQLNSSDIKKKKVP